jgi:teichuronic acid biosynthesis glycosyltransferase TuaG
MCVSLEKTVSVIMPAFNAEDFIAQAMESVVNQTHSDWELIIVDDCSNDRTASIIDSHARDEPRIVFLQQQQNQGVAAARNRALEAAQGEYIAFLDSDDYWLPNKLERQLAIMAEKGALICCSNYMRMDEKGNELGIVEPPRSIHYKDLLKSNFIGNLTGIYKAKELGKVFFKSIAHEDYVAWLTILKSENPAYCIPEVLAFYRVYDQSTSSNKFKTVSWQWKIYREEEQLGFFHSLYLMFFYMYYALQKRV